MKLDVFGKDFEILREGGQWKAYLLGNEGKRRLVRELVFPANLKDTEIAGYMADIYHEAARPGRDKVKVLEWCYGDVNRASKS